MIHKTLPETINSLKIAQQPLYSLAGADDLQNKLEIAYRYFVKKYPNANY